MNIDQLQSHEEESLREKVIDALKTLGIEDPESKRLLDEVLAKKQIEIELIVDENERRCADFKLSIEKAEIYYEAGLLSDALEELTITGQATWDADELEIYDLVSPRAMEIEATLLKQEDFES